jgi:CRP/FNR family transcriptional regulator
MSGTIKSKSNSLIDSLRRCRLFAGLPANDLANIAGISVAKNCAKGAYLFREGETSKGFYVLLRGSVSVHRVNPAGKEQVIHIFQAGESFAEAALASPAGYPADARALEPAQCLLVQKDGMLALLRRQPELALRILASVSAHLRTLVGQLEDLTLKDVETRLTHWLIQHCPEAASDKSVAIELKTTKRLLAAELGTIPETFSRTLAKFRKQKLVTVKGKLIVVLSPRLLNEFLHRSLGGN